VSPDTSDTGPGAGALAETPKQDYVGGRDLTRWPTAAGRVAANLALRAAERVAPRWLLALTLLAGLALVGSLTAVAAEVYDAVAESDGVAVLDPMALRAARALRTGPLNSVVIAYTSLGGVVGMSILATGVAVLLAVVWRQWTPVLLVAATAAGSVAITVLGKAVIGRSRPPEIDAVPPFEHGYSFPSGHTLNAVALAGIVAYLLVRRQHRAWVRIVTVAAAAGFALLMALSRVYLGLHWLTDVLVAWALGLAWLVTVITAHRLFLTVRRRGRSVDGQPHHNIQ
jgi:membrane-associated phospholipid phosphatase